MTLEQFIELLDEKIFVLAKELRDEHGLSNVIIEQNSTYLGGRINIKVSEKG